MENTSLTKSKTITIIGIIFIMISSYLFFIFFTSLSIYLASLKSAFTWLGHVSYQTGINEIEINEMKTHLLKDALINIILGILFLVSGAGCLYLKRWALKIIFLMGIAILGYQSFMLITDVYKFGRYELFGYRIVQILFFVLILIVLSIKKIRTLFV